VGLSTFEHAWSEDQARSAALLAGKAVCLEAPKGWRAHKVLRGISSLVRKGLKRPFSATWIERAQWREVSEAVATFLAQENPDVCWVHDIRPLIRLGEVFVNQQRKVVLDMHDLLSSYSDEHARALRRWPVDLYREGAVFSHFRKSYRMSALRPFDFAMELRSELAAMAAASVVVATSLAEKKLLHENGIPAKYLPPITVAPPAAADERVEFAKTDIGIIGGGHFFNIEGLEYFLEKIWPVIEQLRPGTSLQIAGAMGTRHKNDARLGANVVVTDYVRSLEDFYRDTRVVAVPLLGGSGSCIKTIEAALHGKPVVSLPAGVRGLPDGLVREIVCADAPEAMAAEIVRLLSSEPEVRHRGAQLAALARREYAETNYSQHMQAVLLGI
jgi:glycosyltransferase involved in cell wall biosynthesis